MPRRRGLRPRLLAAVIRSKAISAFAAERQVVRQTVDSARMTSEMTWIAIAVGVAAVFLVIGVLFTRLQPSGFSAPTPWRKTPFTVGRRYRVLRSFQALRDSFSVGEILVYKSVGYSRYDGMTGYFFEAQDDPRTRAWDVGDEEDLSVWKTLFEEVAPSSVVR